MQDKPRRTLLVVRKDRGLSIREMAAIVGCTHPHYLNLEKGKIEPRLRTAVRISRRLGIPMEELFYSCFRDVG